MTSLSVLTLISANGEWRAVKDILPPARLETSPPGEYFAAGGVTYFHGGWGKISAAATAQYALDRFRPDLLVNLGTCGGFAGRVERGTVLLVNRTIVYDILEQMTDPLQAIADYSTDLDLTWLRQPYPHPVQPGLLVSADRDIVPADIPMLVERYGAIAADWESGAIAWVAKRNGVRCLILRGVTDLVGSQGGEAYGNIELFHQSTRTIMATLIRQLPDWLASVR
jgi:adenosylhomocysteine nucleosidase